MKLRTVMISASALLALSSPNVSSANNNPLSPPTLLHVEGKICNQFPKVFERVKESCPPSKDKEKFVEGAIVVKELPDRIIDDGFWAVEQAGERMIGDDIRGNFTYVITKRDDRFFGHGCRFFFTLDSGGIFTAHAEELGSKKGVITCAFNESGKGTRECPAKIELCFLPTDPKMRKK